MRAITKQGNGGYHLERSHNNPPINSNEASSRWKSFAHKTELLQQLLDEQYRLCCYSEVRADELDLGYHIEHVENKNQNPLRTFDYSNLAASALNSPQGLSLFKAQGHGIFGGHATGKQKGVDCTKFVSCHQFDCHRFFAYLSDGRVIPQSGLSPSDVDKARYIIELLNLNSPYLVNLRQQWWDELDGLYQEHLMKDWSVFDLACIDLVPSKKCLSRFFSLTRQFFGDMAEQVLQQCAPELL